MNTENSTERINMKYVYLLTTVAALGGLLFGYDTAVIAGAIGFLQTKFELSAAMKGWAASSAIIGCIYGAAGAGYLSDTFGRKKGLMISAVLFTISAIGSAIPETLTQFAIARFIGGLGVGAASMLSPLFITELAPAKVRGKLVSLYQLAIVIGILIIYFINMMVSGMGNDAWNVEYGWRYMLGSEAIPAILFFGLLFTVPESPRWLAANSRANEAETILSRINGKIRAKIVLNEIVETLKEEQGTLKELFGPHFRKALFIGIMLGIFSQVTGINAIAYYAPEIFKESGAGTGSAMAQTVVIGLCNVIFTFGSILFVDKLGRKTLLLIGAVGMGLSLLMIGLAFQFGWTEGYFLLAFILCYMSSFAASFGPVTWVVMSEIFPTKMRGVAMSVATMILWIAVYFVTQFFPILLDSFGAAKTFWFFGFFTLFAFLFVYYKVPETKGKTLEQIEHEWKSK
jgi:SP family arabinose:H+ symporter-like MFS transporter